MNVGSIFELANRTGLWVFCGAKGEMRDDLGDHGGQHLGRSAARGTYHFRRLELPSERL